MIYRDTTPARHDQLMREEIVRLLEEEGIDLGRIAWQMRRIYVLADCPEGWSAEDFVRWVGRI